MECWKNVWHDVGKLFGKMFRKCWETVWEDVEKMLGKMFGTVLGRCWENVKNLWEHVWQVGDMWGICSHEHHLTWELHMSLL